MKEHLKHFIIFIPLLLLVGVLYFMRNFLPDSLCLLQDTKTIEVNESGFTPNTISVRKCTTVTFKNTGTTDHWPASDPHPTHTGYPGFDPKQPVASSSSWTFTFNKSGTWGYHDHLAPDHHATITVQ
jgi:plastocyanin